MSLHPDAFPGYQIFSELGRGTTGVVYLAEDTRLNNRRVAIKTLLPCPDAEFARRRARFLREVQVMASIAHPGIVPVNLVAEHEGIPYCVRRFIEGDTLESLATTHAINLRTGLRFLHLIAGAVQFIHERGYIHRNLHPSNVLIETEYNAVQLIGFGRAKPHATPAASEDMQSLQQMLRWLAETLSEPLPATLEHATTPAALAKTLGHCL